MDERERLRLRITGEFSKLLKERSIRDALPPLGPDGSIPFVVLLPDDTIRDVISRVRVLGSAAYVIVPPETPVVPAEKLRG